MAANPLPAKYNQLIALAEDAADGAGQHQAAIGLLQNTQARIQADITALSAAQHAFQAERQAKKGLVAAQRSADSNGKAFIASFKNALESTLGSQWSVSWLPTGFVNNSLEIPSSMPGRQTLLATMRDYLTANPAHENAPLNVTAAQATALHSALAAARSAVSANLVKIGQKRTARNAARTALEKRLGGLIDELDQLLAGDDPIWLAFGLNMPDADVTPGRPESLVLSIGTQNTVFAEWDDVVNADYYRLFRQIVGVDAEFIEVNPNPSDSFAMVGAFSNGQTVRVKVRAVTGTLEGPDSEVAEVTLPSA